MNPDMALVQIHSGFIKDLLDLAKNHPKHNRDFTNWGLSDLLPQAIREMRDKYSEEAEK